MVRSMISLITLPLSFWDYALESAARILNMIPTKKVDKTLYELWHGKVPNLSYLKESGINVELDDKDILPSENTSEHPIEEESLAPIVSQKEDVVPVRSILRLVAKGFTQILVFDYEGKISPVAEIRAIRMSPIALEAVYDYEIWQMDVKTAFLNGFLEEEIYMEQPEGFIDPNHPSKNGYSKRGSIPMQVDLHLNKSQCATTSVEIKHMQNVPYASVVGSIMYAVRCTRPDVALFAKHHKRIVKNLGKLTWDAVKNYS
ncbi:retrotransposon protein, putative, ty1-copia subclass [Tanacetum coccineum]